MPDWIAMVRTRLGALGLAPKREAEIVAELADHLEDLYEDYLQKGLAEPDAIERALATVSNWPALRLDIRREECREGTMGGRVKSLWLPGLLAAGMFWGSLRLSGEVLSHFARFDPTKGFKPLPMGILLIVFGAWVILLAGVGAFTACVSRYLGGRPRHQILTALFPTATLQMFFLVVSLLAFLLLPERASSMAWRLILFGTIPATMIFPGLPLVVGAALVTGYHERLALRSALIRFGLLQNVSQQR